MYQTRSKTSIQFSGETYQASQSAGYGASFCFRFSHCCMLWEGLR